MRICTGTPASPDDSGRFVGGLPPWGLDHSACLRPRCPSYLAATARHRHHINNPLPPACADQYPLQYDWVMPCPALQPHRHGPWACITRAEHRSIHVIYFSCSSITLFRSPSALLTFFSHSSILPSHSAQHSPCPSIPNSYHLCTTFALLARSTATSLACASCKAFNLAIRGCKEIREVDRLLDGIARSWMEVS